VRSAECGVRSAECGVRSVGAGITTSAPFRTPPFHPSTLPPFPAPNPQPPTPQSQLGTPQEACCVLAGSQHSDVASAKMQTCIVIQIEHIDSPSHTKAATKGYTRNGSHASHQVWRMTVNCTSQPELTMLIPPPC